MTWAEGKKVLDEKLIERIETAVDDAFDEQLGFTQALVRFPTQRGQEHTAQEFMAQSLRERDLPVDRWTIDVEDIRHHPGFSPVTISYDNALNVVGTHRPKKATGRSLILNGHIDVVPTGPVDFVELPSLRATDRRRVDVRPRVGGYEGGFGGQPVRV